MERCREGLGRWPVLGDTRSLGSGGGASLRPGRGQSPDRAALQRLSSGTTQVLFRNGGDQGAWRLGRSGVPKSRDAGGKRAPTGKGPGHVSRGASEQRARGGRPPGIVGGRGQEGVAGSKTPSGQGAVWRGVTRPPQGKKGRLPGEGTARDPRDA